MTVAERPAFVIPAGTHTLVLGDELAGGEIDVRQVYPYRVVRDIRRHLREYASAEEEADESVALDALYRTFAEGVLVGWNLEDDAGPIPADFDGMHRLPMYVAQTIIRTWLVAVGLVMPPLPQPSTTTTGTSPDGRPSAASATPAALA